MRLLTTILLSGLLSGLLAGCATPAGMRGETEEQRLSRECRARGGILVPSGANTGRPQIDFVCQISGGARRTPG